MGLQQPFKQVLFMYVMNGAFVVNSKLLSMFSITAAKTERFNIIHEPYWK